MSLDKIFTERVEQPIQEKVLRTAKREEVILNEWCSYFEKTKKDEWDFGDINEQDCFLKTQEFLQSFKITPELISKFYDKIYVEKIKLFPKNKALKFLFRKIGLGWVRKAYLGLFLSAAIQTSYDQGFNDFKFGEVYSNFFGYSLRGETNAQIKVKVKKLNGWLLLDRASNCSLEVDTLEGYSHLRDTNNCTTQIKSYKGVELGYDMTNCTIYAPNSKILKKIEKQVKDKKTNKFFIQPMLK